MNFSSTLLHVNQSLWLLQIIWTGKLNKRCKTFLKEADSFPLVRKGMIRWYIMAMGGTLLFLVISTFPLSLLILAYPCPFICFLTHKFHIFADMKRREQHVFSYTINSPLYILFWILLDSIKYFWRVFFFKCCFILRYPSSYLLSSVLSDQTPSYTFLP